MSYLYKEWQDLMREYTKEQQPVHDSYWQERTRLNKEYALQQSTATRSKQSEKQNDK